MPIHSYREYYSIKYLDLGHQWYTLMLKDLLWVFHGFSSQSHSQPTFFLPCSKNSSESTSVPGEGRESGRKELGASPGINESCDSSIMRMSPEGKKSSWFPPRLHIWKAPYLRFAYSLSFIFMLSSEKGPLEFLLAVHFSKNFHKVDSAHSSPLWVSMSIS